MEGGPATAASCPVPLGEPPPAAAAVALATAALSSRPLGEFSIDDADMTDDRASVSVISPSLPESTSSKPLWTKRDAGGLPAALQTLQTRLADTLLRPIEDTLRVELAPQPRPE